MKILKNSSLNAPWVTQKFDTVDFDKITTEQANVLATALADFSRAVEEHDKAGAVLTSHYVTFINAVIVYLWLSMLTTPDMTVTGIAVLLIINVVLSRFKTRLTLKKINKQHELLEDLDRSFQFPRL